MINYTERISVLMRDIVARVPAAVLHRPRRTAGLRAVRPVGRRGRLRHLPLHQPAADRARLLLLARPRRRGAITRRSRWFVTKSPAVFVGGTRDPVPDLVHAAALLRPDAARLAQGAVLPTACPGWIAKLDTVVHELYHIDPERAGIRHVERATAAPSASGRTAATSSKTVADMVREYLGSDPGPGVLRVPPLRLRRAGARDTAAWRRPRSAPSRRIPQRYIELLPPTEQPEMPASVRIQPLKTNRPADQLHRARPRRAAVPDRQHAARARRAAG